MPPMTDDERRTVEQAAAWATRELDRLRERGPWRDPRAEVRLTGRRHADRVARQEQLATGLRALLR